MRTTRFQLIPGLLALFPSFLLPNDSGETASWDLLLEEVDETEVLLEDWESGVTLEPDPEPVPSLFLSTSIFAKIGYTDNVLQGNEPLSSGILQPQIDFFLTAYPTDHTVLTVFAFGEWSYFTRGLETRDETLVFAQADAQWVSNRWIFGSQLDFFYGDQIFDSSLGLPGDRPQGSNLRQFSQTFSPYAEWAANPFHRLRGGPYAKRTDYADDDDNFQEFGAFFEWEADWTDSLRSTLKLQSGWQDFDDRPVQNLSGIPFQGRLLEIWSHEANLKWEAELPFWALESTSRLQYEYREDNGFGYEDQNRVEFSQEFERAFGHLTARIGGRLLLVNYEGRLAGGRTVNRQQKNSLFIDLEYELNPDHELYLEYSWDRFTSRIELESFESHEILIGIARYF